MRFVGVPAGGGLGEDRRCFGWLREVMGEPGNLWQKELGKAHCGARNCRRGARWQQRRLRLVGLSLAQMERRGAGAA